MRSTSCGFESHLRHHINLLQILRFSYYALRGPILTLRSAYGVVAAAVSALAYSIGATAPV